MLSTASESPRGDIRNDHQAIRASVEAIETLLRRVGDGELEGRGARRLLEAFEGLTRELLEHFAREEAPQGIFARVLLQAPRLDRRVRAVRRQHRPLGAELGQILEDAGYAGMAPDAWREVAERFRAFAQTLRDHELAEDRILTDAYFDDLGGGD